MLIADPLIRAEQANAIRNGLTDESGQRISLHIGDDASDDIALPLDRASDDCLTGSASSAAPVAALIFVPVLGEATDESLVHLDNAAELFGRFDQSGSDLVAHFPSGFVRTEAHVPLNLQRAHSFLAGQHQVDDAKPLSEGFIRVLEDRSNQDGEPIAVRRAFFALPMPFAGGKVIDGGIATARAADAFRPSASPQIGFAGILIREQFFELRDAQLMNWFWTSGHGRSPTVEGMYHA